MQWFITVVVIAALGLAAMAAAGGLGEMRKQPVRDFYRQDLPTERALTAAEVEGIRFAVTVRGYSMAQVDDVIDRLVTEIAMRDAKLAELQHGDEVGDPPQDDGAESAGTPEIADPDSEFDKREAVER